jgi:hypothetical protein
MDISFYRGFYLSVNVGYAIYWTTEEIYASTKAFSVLHVLLGQLITTIAMASFAGRLKRHWYNFGIDVDLIYLFLVEIMPYYALPCYASLLSYWLF